MDGLKILMLSKRENVFCDYAEAILKSYFAEEEVLSVRGSVGDWLNDELRWYEPQYVISFVSPWIVPQPLLAAAQKAALNFHPGPPAYPGTGCYNFALYEGAKRYGVTVHHMRETVDTGDIVMTSYFDVSPFETVETMKLKSMNHLLFCFERIMAYIAADDPLPVSRERWLRKPFTRKEMYALFEIDPDRDDETEIGRRIRAATYPSSNGAYVTVGGRRFYHPYEDRDPIVK